ncbi:MAG: ParM/StbA family protein [Rhizobium sp.]|nr:MAG: ParM/StbA family protein [Rhizobium sp.]
MSKHVVAADVGYSNLKCVWAMDSEAPVRLGGNAKVLPSGARVVDESNARLVGRDESILVVVDGKKYEAGVTQNELSASRTLTPQYSQTPGYRALMNAALVLSGYQTVDMMVTGLPVSQYQDAQLKEKLRASLIGEREIAPGLVVNVLDAAVVAQPVGGYMDAVVSNSSDEVLREGDVLVIDPGFFSNDHILLSNGSFIAERSGTSNLSVHAILRKAVELMSENTGKAFGIDRLESALRQKKKRVLVEGQQTNYQPFLAKAIEAIVPGAVEEICATLSVRGKRLAIDRVLVVGGGAELFIPTLKKVFGDHLVSSCPAPELANARGFLHFGHSLLEG